MPGSEARRELTERPGPRADGDHIRSAAGRASVPLLTTGVRPWPQPRACRTGRPTSSRFEACRSTTRVSRSAPSSRAMVGRRTDGLRTRSGRCPPCAGDDGIGDCRPWCRVRQLSRSGVARCGRREVDEGRRVGGIRRLGCTDGIRDDQFGRVAAGVPHWLEHDLPDLLATGATVVASIWGSMSMTTPERPQRWRRRPKASLRSRSMSCPNLEDRGRCSPTAVRRPPRSSRHRRSLAGRCGPSSVRTPPTFPRSPRLPTALVPRRWCSRTPCSAW